MIKKVLFLKSMLSNYRILDIDYNLQVDSMNVYSLYFYFIFAFFQ